MRILRQTDAQLQVMESYREQRHLGIAWVSPFMGIALLMMGIAVFDLGTVQLICRRVEPTQVSCDREASKLIGLWPQPVTALRQVSAATVQTTVRTDSDGSTTVDNWVTLTTAAGEVVLVEDRFSISGNRGNLQEMEAIAAEINSFLQSDRPTFELSRDSRFRPSQSLFPLSFLGTFVGFCGFVLWLVFRAEVITFDKTSQQLTRQSQFLLGSPSGKKTTTCCALREIRGVTIDTTTDSEGDKTYALKLLLSDVRQYPLMRSSNRQQAEQIRDRIEAFLQLERPQEISGDRPG